MDVQAGALYEYAVQLLGDPRTEAGRRLLQERSPLSHAGQFVRTLLIAQGANDPAVPRDQSDRMVAALKAAHRPVTYLLYPEGHGFIRRQNQLAFHAVAESFLAQYLGGSSGPIGSDLDRSVLRQGVFSLVR